MRYSYGPGYTIPLPGRHAFPMGKYEALYRILCDEGLIVLEEGYEPYEADWADLRLVHTPEYLKSLEEDSLGPAARRKLGLPFSDVLLERARLAVQGTIAAARFALSDGVGANLAGGTHHAFPDHGEGYCLLNDVAVAVRVLERSGQVRRVLIVDLDVHQGNGTAAIFSDDASIFTLSIHGENNYPWTKSKSSLDVSLPDGTGDRGYLEALGESLNLAIGRSVPDLIFYLAGVDPVVGDRFGRLALTLEGLGSRDRYVLTSARRYGIPIVMVPAGGYAPTPELTADLHAVVHREWRAVLSH